MKIATDSWVKARPTETNWAKVAKRYVGKKFRFRRIGRQETRWVVDVTLGCSVIYRWGPKYRYLTTVSYNEWAGWVSDAKEVE